MLNEDYCKIVLAVRLTKCLKFAFKKSTQFSFVAVKLYQLNYKFAFQKQFSNQIKR